MAGPSFPKDFLLGVATASYELEGGASADGRASRSGTGSVTRRAPSETAIPETWRATITDGSPRTSP